MPRNKLDDFTRAYIEAMLWSTTDESDESGGEPLDQNYGIDDIAPETMELIVEDCADFQKRFGHLIEDEPEVRGEDRWDRWELAGHDFWLTRVGSGVGFWVGDWPKNGDELSEASKSYGSFDLFVEDGVISYGSSPDYYRSHRHVGEIREARRQVPVYTVEPGRNVYRNGQPFVSVGREGGTIPADADEVAHALADALNQLKWEPRWGGKRTAEARRRR